MKEVIRKIAHLFGYQIIRIGGRTKRTALADSLEHIAKLGQEIGFKPLTVIDVGVATGTPELYRSFPQSKFLLIEPLKEFEDNLKEICKEYDATYIIAAATNQKGTTFINITPDLNGSSILKPKEAYLDCNRREVPTVMIDSLVDEFKLKGPFVLKVDAQSSELYVLGGAIQAMGASEVIILEVQLFQFVLDGPQFFDIVAFLKERGFVVYDIVGHNYRPLDNALAEVDIVFVKENGIFRSSHLFATAEQRQKQFSGINTSSKSVLP